MKHFCINSLIISILVLSTSCAPGPSAPTTALLGQWAFASSDGGSEDFASSLVFDEAGTLTIEENWFNQGATLSYVVIAPGRLKITYQDQPQLVNYDLQEDTLTLIFKSGSNTYSRISRPATPPPADSQITTAEPPNTPFPPTATHTLTWAPTFTIQPPTPTPTNTKSEPTKTPSKYLTPTPKAYYPLPNCAASQLHVGDSAYISYEGKKTGYAAHLIHTHLITSLGKFYRAKWLRLLMAPSAIMAGSFGRCAPPVMKSAGPQREIPKNFICFRSLPGSSAPTRCQVA